MTSAPLPAGSRVLRHALGESKLLAADVWEVSVDPAASPSLMGLLFTRAGTGAPDLIDQADRLRHRVGSRGGIVLPREIAATSAGPLAISDRPVGMSLRSFLETQPEHALRVDACVAVARTVNRFHRQAIVCGALAAEVLWCPPTRNPSWPLLVYTRFDAASTDGHGLCPPAAPSTTYRAPEQAGGVLASPAMDVYSLGVLLVQILSERPCGNDPAKRRTEILSAVEGLAGCDLHREVIATLRACLANDPARRPAAYHVVAALEQHQRTEFEAVTSAQRASPAPTSPVTELSYVSLTGPRGFQRTYYNSVELSARALRGLDPDLLEALRGTSITLRFGPDGPSLLRRPGAPGVALSGHAIPEAVETPLPPGAAHLQIGAISLSMRVGRTFRAPTST